MPVNPQFVNFVADGGKDRIVLVNGEVTSGTITTDPGKARITPFRVLTVMLMFASLIMTVVTAIWFLFFCLK